MHSFRCFSSDRKVIQQWYTNPIQWSYHYNMVHFTHICIRALITSYVDWWSREFVANGIAQGKWDCSSHNIREHSPTQFKNLEFWNGMETKLGNAFPLFLSFYWGVEYDRPSLNLFHYSTKSFGFLCVLYLWSLQVSLPYCMAVHQSSTDKALAASCWTQPRSSLGAAQPMMVPGLLLSPATTAGDRYVGLLI